MGTRAAAFTAKIKTLQEAQMRLMQSQMQAGQSEARVRGGGGSGGSGANDSSPNGVELANTLKWFSNTLLNVLKDVPGQPFIMMKSKENDPERMSLYPSLDYKGLYSAMLNFIDLVQYVAPHGLYDFGKAFLITLCSLVPFLERELIDTLPYMSCAMITALPQSLNQDLIDVICWRLVPFTISIKRPRDNLPLSDDIDANRDNYASKSASAMLMMVFQVENSYTRAS